MFAMPGRRLVLDRIAKRLFALLPFLACPRLGWPSVLSRCVLVIRMDALMTATFAIIYRANLARHIAFLLFSTMSAVDVATQRLRIIGKFRAGLFGQLTL